MCVLVFVSFYVFIVHSSLMLCHKRIVLLFYFSLVYLVGKGKHVVSLFSLCLHPFFLFFLPFFFHLRRNLSCEVSIFCFLLLFLHLFLHQLGVQVQRHLIPYILVFLHFHISFSLIFLLFFLNRFEIVSFISISKSSFVILKERS